MGLKAGQAIAGMKVDVAFIGSCTNGRLSDLREAARIVRGHHVAKGVKALVVPGSVAVQKAAEREGLDVTFRDAGFEFRLEDVSAASRRSRTATSGGGRPRAASR